MSQEKDLQRIELRLDRKVVELLDKKAEIENVKRAEYIRRLIYKDIKSIIRDSRDEVDNGKIEKITEYVREIQELRKASNKLGAILNQSIRYKMFGLKEENYSDLEQEFNELYVRVTEILYYLKNNL
jgi:ribbon-helix-helix protein, copG family